jgi:hypothetical protein
VLLAWAAALLALLEPRIALSRPELVFLALACGVAGLTALGAFWSDSVTSTLLEAERALVVVAAVLALLLAGDRTWMLRGVVAAATLLAVWNLVAGGDEPFGYANGLGALVAVAIPLALRERFLWPALAALVPALVVSGSRGSVIALGLAAIVALVRRPVLVVPAVVAVVAVAWVAYGFRDDYYRVALHEARAAPIVGTGPGTWEQWWLERRPTPHQALDAHSVYLETLGEQGVVGVALLVALLATPLVGRPRDRLVLAAYAVFVIHAAVDWDREQPALWIAGLTAGIAFLPRAAANDTRHNRRAAVVVAALALGGLGALSGVAQISLERARDRLAPTISRAWRRSRGGPGGSSRGRRGRSRCSASRSSQPAARRPRLRHSDARFQKTGAAGSSGTTWPRRAAAAERATRRGASTRSAADGAVRRRER